MSCKERKEHRQYGDFLAEERERLGYTQAEFARLVDVSIQRLRALEASSGRLPCYVKLHNMAVRGVDLNYVLTGKRVGEGLIDE